MVDPPRIFPATIEVLEIGVINTYFKNPNSLSQIMDMALKKEVKSTVIPIMPGNIKYI